MSWSELEGAGGDGETDGDKKMQDERAMPRGEQRERPKGWKEAEPTDRDKTERERERDGEYEEAAPSNGWTADTPTRAVSLESSPSAK